MSVDVIIEDDRWEALSIRDVSTRAVQATLAGLSLEAPDRQVSLLACDDARIAALNADFRGKPQPTNVLSWPSETLASDSDGRPPQPPADPELGDIAIAFETCAREADEQGKPFDHHVAHLIVHGTLHLLGYDHIRPKDAALMEGLEVEILATLGLPDPY